MAATGEFVLDPTTGQPQYRIMQDDSGLLHVQVRRRPANTVMRGENIQRPPLHNIREARLQPQVDTHNVYSSVGVDSAFWVKENDASDASKARTCGPKSSPQSYGEGTHFAPSQHSLPYTISLQHTTKNPFNTQNANYSSLPPQSDPRGFGQGTLGLYNTVLETTTSVEGNGAGAIFHYEPRYHGSGNFPQAILYQNQQCEPLGTALVDDQVNTSGNFVRAAESQYYQAPSRGASNVPRPSSGSSQYMVGAESQTTPDMPHMPMLEVQNQAAVAPHPTDAYQHFPPAVTAKDAHYANVLNGDAMDSQMASIVPTPGDQYMQCAFSPPDPDANEWTMEELPARSKDTDDYVAYDPVADNERTPSATEDLSRFDVSTLVPSSIGNMSVLDVLLAAGEEINYEILRISLCPVQELAQVMLKGGYQPAQVFKQMVQWSYKISGFKCAYPQCSHESVYMSKGALMKHVDKHFFRYVCANPHCNSSLCCDFTFNRHWKGEACVETVTKIASETFPGVEKNKAVKLLCLRNYSLPFPWLSRDLF